MEKKTPRNGKDLSGQTLGKWHLLEFLGEGATAHVYRAEDKEHGEYVRAVKVFFINDFTEEEKKDRLNRLMQEALLCKIPIHSNVIWVTEPPRKTKEYIFHVMPYADGGSLLDVIQRVKQEGSQISLEEVRRWGLQIASGLSAIHAHENGLVHRDICPTNLLLNKKDILIADLGIAQTRYDLTRRAEMTGSAPGHPGHPNYMSPQQANDKRPVKPADDIFSAGCVLFELLTLQVYLGEKTTLLPHPKQYRGDMPDWLDRIVACCLAERREDRFQSANELRQSLEQKRLIRRALDPHPDVSDGADLDDLAELLGRIPRMTIARGVVLDVPEDLPAAAEKAWQECLEAFFEPQGRGGFLDWLKEDVIETLRKQRNLPARKKMEELLARSESLHQKAGAQDDLLTRSRIFTEFLAGFESFHPPVVGFTPGKGLDFGELGLGGAPVERRLTVKNNGSCLLVFRMGSSHTALKVKDQTIHECPPGKDLRLELALQPSRNMPAAIRLEFESNAGDKQFHISFSQDEARKKDAEKKARQEEQQKRLAAAQAKAQQDAQSRARAEEQKKADELARIAQVKKETDEKKRLEAEERKNKNLFLTLAPGVVMEFVRVQAGEFEMGSEYSFFQNEMPVHKVYLFEYLIGKYPVTNRQYAAFVRSSRQRSPKHWQGGEIPSGKEEHPVVNVRWKDAKAFCAWASKVTKAKVRLPSEAEWEKAARGTDGRNYPWGSQTWDSIRCNYGEKIKDTTPVGKYSPQGDSPYGCADMAGNVREWVNDWYGENYYKGSPTSNPPGPSFSSFRVLRGGSWDSPGYDLSNGYRSWSTPGTSNRDIGFRCSLGTSP